MRLMLSLLAALALLPSAAARVDVPDVSQGDQTVGPCRAWWQLGWSGWSGNWKVVECVVDGEEVLHVSEGDSYWGHHCSWRLLGETLRECSPETEW